MSPRLGDRPLYIARWLAVGFVQDLFAGALSREIARSETVGRAAIPRSAKLRETAIASNVRAPVSRCPHLGIVARKAARERVQARVTRVNANLDAAEARPGRRAAKLGRMKSAQITSARGIGARPSRGAGMAVRHIFPRQRPHSHTHPHKHKTAAAEADTGAGLGP